MFHVANDDLIAFNESNPSRKLRDNSDENKVVALLHQANVFNANNQATIPERLQNIVTKDVATTRIEESLLEASSLGQEELISFVKERLVTPSEDGHQKKLRDPRPLPKNKAPTFSTLYEVKKNDTEKCAAIKADRNTLQRIITAYDAGRRVDLPQILSHELTAVPLAIFDVSGQLRTGNKWVMMEVLSSDTERPRVTPIAGGSTLVVDGQALVMALGRPSECNTFDDLGDKFVRAVLASGKDFHRIDVTFDRYRETSIKCMTRKKRSRGYAPIRNIIEDGSVPLPKSWSNVVAFDENKGDLARFLSDKLLAGAPVDKIIIVGGGFQEEDAVKCSNPNIDIRALKGSHEEADTRMILHCVHSDAEFLVVSCQDTDVFFLLVSHLDKMSCKQLWIRAGTSKKPNYLPIHTIRHRLKEKFLK